MSNKSFSINVNALASQLVHDPELWNSLCQAMHEARENHPPLGTSIGKYYDGKNWNTLQIQTSSEGRISRGSSTKNIVCDIIPPKDQRLEQPPLPEQNVKQLLRQHPIEVAGNNISLPRNFRR